MDTKEVKESPRCVADSSNEATHQDPEGAGGEETGPSRQPEQGHETPNGTETAVEVDYTRPSARPRTRARPRPRTDPVTLYHQYRVFYENFKRPWDRAKRRLRDELRKKLG